MTDSPIIQGLELMVAGMGTVFVFLTVLVFATSGMSFLVRRFEPLPAVEEEAGVSEEEVAAITAAVVRHRRSGGR